MDKNFRLVILISILVSLVVSLMVSISLYASPSFGYVFTQLPPSTTTECTYSGNLQCSGGCPSGQSCNLIQGPYPSCACQTSPPPLGACCNQYGTNCIGGVTIDGCGYYEGDWQGSGSTCEPNPCVPWTPPTHTCGGFFSTKGCYYNDILCTVSGGKPTLCNGAPCSDCVAKGLPTCCIDD